MKNSKDCNINNNIFFLRRNLNLVRLKVSQKKERNKDRERGEKKITILIVRVFNINF